MDLRDQLQSTLGSAYSVERELGGGGMSRVFLAEETSLGRKVVVKMLSGDLVAGISGERFAREVRLAASLQHPNIVPVLTTGIADGIPYYTMPYVKGESLRARMRQSPVIPRRQAVSVLRDVARALQYAHAEGVIHRDIKPENVLLSSDTAVVTDFGIAKAISAARTSASPQTPTESGLMLTQAGSSVGTPAYMAPEQIAGDTMDHRLDLYAWGIVAYELLSGAHPFAGKTTAQQFMAAHLSQSPPPLAERAPDVAPVITDLVMRCLQKNPDDRPPSATQLVDLLDNAHLSSADHPRPPLSRRRPSPIALGLVVVALLAVGAYAYGTKLHSSSGGVVKSSVAVLPFADDRADPAEAYFGEGIADELMSALGKVQGLRVASRTSAIALGRRHDLDVKEIGSRLGVATVVEGTVRRAGGRLRVTAQLTNTSDGLTLWSDTYERENKDVFAVQDEITKAIVTALRPELAGQSSAQIQKSTAGPGTSNPEAYDLYLRGLYLIERRGAGVARSADYFSQAIAKDSGFARAYAGLADALEFFPYFSGVPAAKIEATATAAARRSLELDPALAEPHVALAMAHMHAFRWKEAEAEFKAALAADSTSPVAHTQYGRFLAALGRIQESFAEFKRARTLDPLAGTASVWLSNSLSIMGNHEAAWEESKRTRELDPNLVTARTILAMDRVQAGHSADARAIVGDDVPPVPFNGMTAYVLQKAGDTAKAAAIRRNLDAMNDTTWMIHTARAFAYLATPDTAKALTEIEAAFGGREIFPTWIPLVERIFDPVRHSVRFAAVLRRWGLEGTDLTGRYGGRPAP
jgi:serine/threonine protein kinase/tetratricopeptide (TPR) repeat protein